MSELCTLLEWNFFLWLSDVARSRGPDASPRAWHAVEAREDNSPSSVLWDNDATIDATRLARLRAAIDAQGPPKSPFWRERIIGRAAKSWDNFYCAHGDGFFHERAWVDRDFPVLRRAATAHFALLEFGCGTGASFLPLLERLPYLDVTAFDLSAKAIALAHSHATFKANSHRACAFVADATDASVTVAAAVKAAHGRQRLFDAVLLLYMLSAMPPETHCEIIARAAACLKPGGLLLLRDYGEGDEAQMRFGRGQMIDGDGSVMVRRDGTLAVFLSLQNLTRAVALAGLEETGGDVDAPATECAAAPVLTAPMKGASYLFRRYQNRATGENLQRVWVHGIWRKPLQFC